MREGFVARTQRAELKRDWIHLQLGVGRLVGLEACGRLVGLVWRGEGGVDVRDPGPERGHVLANLFENLPGENVLEALVLIGSDGALEELLAEALPDDPERAAEGPWSAGGVPVGLRALAAARLGPFDPLRQSGRTPHPPGEILFAPEPTLGGLWADLKLVGMERASQSGSLEILSDWIEYQWTTGAGFAPAEPGHWARRGVGSARPLLLSALSSEEAVSAGASPFAEGRIGSAADLLAASISLVVEPTFGLDRDLKSVDLVSSLELRPAPGLRWLALALDEGRGKAYGEPWSPQEVQGIALGASGDGLAVWHRAGDRLWVELPEAPEGEPVWVRVRHGGDLIEPDGQTAISPLAGWGWYPRTPLPDRHRFELVAVMPRFWDLAATGRRIEESVDARNRTVTSREVRPVLAGAAFIVDARTRVTAARDGLPVVRVMHSPNTTGASVAGVGGEIHRHLAQLEAVLGPFPYSELEIVERSASGGWTDTPGILALGRFDSPPDQVITSRAGARTLLDGLGRQVLAADLGPRTMHDRWLVEGLGVWAECFALQATEQAARCHGNLSGLRNRWTDLVQALGDGGPSTRDWPVGSVWLDEASGWGHANRSVRGPLVLHRLRLLIGDDTSRPLLRRVADAYRGQALSTRSFILQAQAVSGLDLRTFFYGWVYATPQEPVAQVRWSTEEHADGTVSLTLSGRLDAGRDAAPIPMLSPVLLRFEVGDEAAWQRLVLNETEQTLVLEGLPAMPKKLVLDPGHTFPGKVELTRAE